MGSASSGMWTTCLSFADGSEVKFAINNEILLGENPTDVRTPHLNLAAYQTVQFGTSAHHALLRYDGVKHYLVPLDDAKPTLVNEYPIAPHVPYQLTTNDRIQLGTVAFKISFNTTILNTSVQMIREGLHLDLFNTQVIPNKRIMIVEDDIDVGQMYQFALQREGYRVEIVGDVVTAIRQLSTNTPDLIILDLMLPAIHGLELCRYVRKDINFPNLPILVLSARNEAPLIQQTMEAGADVYMVKPPNLTEMQRIIAALIRHVHSEPDQAQHTKLFSTSHTNLMTTLAFAPRLHTLILFINGAPDPLAVIVANRTVLGRQPQGPKEGNFIDLEMYGGFKLGVSRNHAAFVYDHEHEKFRIEDLHSVNGTFINGYALSPNELYPLNNGDEVRLGGLTMHVYMLAEEEPNRMQMPRSPIDSHDY